MIYFVWYVGWLFSIGFSGNEIKGAGEHILLFCAWPLYLGSKVGELFK